MTASAPPTPSRPLPRPAAARPPHINRGHAADSQRRADDPLGGAGPLPDGAPAGRARPREERLSDAAAGPAPERAGDPAAEVVAVAARGERGRAEGRAGARPPQGEAPVAQRARAPVRVAPAAARLRLSAARGAHPAAGRVSLLEFALFEFAFF